MARGLVAPITRRVRSVPSELPVGSPEGQRRLGSVVPLEVIGIPGASGATGECVPRGEPDNLRRLANALRQLGARLRMGGMTDDEARLLPVRLDAETLRSFGSSTWMTDARPIDILRELRDRTGRDVSFETLRSRTLDHEIGGLVVHVAGLGVQLGRNRQIVYDWLSRMLDASDRSPSVTT